MTEKQSEADSLILEVFLIRKAFEDHNNLMFDLIEVLGHTLSELRDRKNFPYPAEPEA